MGGMSHGAALHRARAFWCWMGQESAWSAPGQQRAPLRLLEAAIASTTFFFLLINLGFLNELHVRLVNNASYKRNQRSQHGWNKQPVLQVQPVWWSRESRRQRYLGADCFLDCFSICLLKCLVPTT